MQLPAWTILVRLIIMLVNTRMLLSPCSKLQLHTRRKGNYTCAESGSKLPLNCLVCYHRSKPLEPIQSKALSHDRSPACHPPHKLLCKTLLHKLRLIGPSMTPTSLLYRGLVRMTKVYRISSNRAPIIWTVRLWRIYRSSLSIINRWATPSSRSSIDRVFVSKIFAKLPTSGLQCTTFVSLVSSLDVRRNGINLVPPVPTSSCVFGFSATISVEVEAISLLFTWLAGFAE